MRALTSAVARNVGSRNARQRRIIRQGSTANDAGSTVLQVRQIWPRYPLRHGNAVHRALAPPGMDGFGMTLAGPCGLGHLSPGDGRSPVQRCASQFAHRTRSTQAHAAHAVHRMLHAAWCHGACCAFCRVGRQDHSHLERRVRSTCPPSLLCLTVGALAHPCHFCMIALTAGTSAPGLRSPCHLTCAASPDDRRSMGAEVHTVAAPWLYCGCTVVVLWLHRGCTVVAPRFARVALWFYWLCCG